ncbi:MAG: transaldolase family protein [Gammaproteobacteria bacterium]|nr:transaldolase family protein [Gammaproteobacteria bacterium]
MPKTKMQLTSETATDFWNDSCSIKELSEAIQNGAVGATSNPVIVGTVVKQEANVWGQELDALIKNNPDVSEDEIAWQLTEKIGIAAAKLLMPVFEKNDRMCGRLSLQVNPTFYREKHKMVEHAIHLSNLAPNIAIKAPCTATGLAALEEMTANGVVINGTVSFTVPQALACAEAVERGLKRAESKGIDIKRMTPYVTIMVGRLDDHLKQIAKNENIDINPEYLEWAGVAVFKKAYQLFCKRNYRATLLAAAYRNTLHWSEFIGGKVVLTIPYAWWNKFNNSDIAVKERMDTPVQDEIINALYTKFADFRKAYDVDGMQPEDFIHYGATIKTLHQFVSSYYDLLNFIREKRLV